MFLYRLREDARPRRSPHAARRSPAFGTGNRAMSSVKLFCELKIESVMHIKHAHISNLTS